MGWWETKSVVFDVIQSEIKVTCIENPTRVRISKPLIFFSSRHYGGQNKRRCAFAAIPLVQRFVCACAHLVLGEGIVTGDDAPLFYEPCQGENERVAPMRVVKVPLKKSLSISKKLFVVARRFFFLTNSVSLPDTKRRKVII